MKILNKNGLPYSIRVLFAPGVVILPIELDLSDFFEFRFSLYKERTRWNTSVVTMLQVWLTNCGLVPPRVWFANVTRLPSRLQRSLGRGSNNTDLFHSFIVSLGIRRAAWRRSQGCDCAARRLKWKINLCPWILRWWVRGSVRKVVHGPGPQGGPRTGGQCFRVTLLGLPF